MAKFIKYITFSLLLAVLPITHCYAGVEPNFTLALRFEQAKERFEKAFHSIHQAQYMEVEGQVFIGREVQATNEYLREVNNYLDTFHDVVSLAAEIYGTFLEVKRTKRLLGQVSSALSDAPTNAIAVLLTPNTSGLYGSIIQISVEAAQGIYNACISKKKMTEQDRNKLLDEARMKIRKVNSDLAKLVIVLKYTTFEDIWFSVRTHVKYMNGERKHAIIERCYDNWKHNRSRVVIN